MKNSIEVKVDIQTSIIMLLTGYGIISVLAFNAVCSALVFLNTMYNDLKNKA